MLDVMARAAKKWSLIGIEFRDHAKEKSEPTSGSSSKRKRGKSVKSEMANGRRSPSLALGVASKASPQAVPEAQSGGRQR